MSNKDWQLSSSNSFWKIDIQKTSNRKRLFDIKDTDLSSIEIKNIPPSVSEDLCQEPAKLVQGKRAL